MIVPRASAVRLAAATFLPAALAVAALPESRVAAAGLCLAVVLVAAIDALLAERQRRGITAEFPERVNLSQDREGILPFTVAEQRNARRSLVLALESLQGFTSPCLQQRLVLGAGDTGVRVQWPVTGTRRGDFLLQGCRLRLRSPLGLWYAQGALPAGTTLRVYPNLRQERKRLAALFLNRNDALIRPQRQVGQGREFEKLRLYLPGDSLADIHWRASAKRGQLVTKEFQIERTREVYVIVDASRLSSRGVAAGKDGKEEPLLERYIRSALILGNVAQRQGDRFGVMAFGEGVLAFKRANSGKEHFGVCRDALYALTPGSANPGYDEAASFLAQRLKRRALLIFLTSLDEPALAEGFARSIRVLSRRHLVCVAMLRPAAAAPLFSGQSVEELDDLYRSLGGHLLWHSLREMQQNLRLSGVQLSLVDHEGLSAEVVSKYLDVKRRQLL